jgi:hypothetical protein
MIPEDRGGRGVGVLTGKQSQKQNNHLATGSESPVSRFPQPRTLLATLNAGLELRHA